jgi:hypothetical protein
MPLSLILACLWVLAAAIVAMLPMRLQYAPGLDASDPVPFRSRSMSVLQVGWIWVAARDFRRPVHVPPSAHGALPPPAPPPCRRNLMPVLPDLRAVWGLLAGGGARRCRNGSGGRWSWALIGTGIPLLGLHDAAGGTGLRARRGWSIAVLLISRTPAPRSPGQVEVGKA